MPIFTATVRVVHVEAWEIEADDEDAARAKIDHLDPDVVTDDTGGEIVDWEITGIRQEP